MILHIWFVLKKFWTLKSKAIKDTPIRVVNDSTNETRELYWDEENQLMVLSDNGKTSRYTYNAAGERIMKSYGTMEGVYINGAPQGISFQIFSEAR